MKKFAVSIAIAALVVSLAMSSGIAAEQPAGGGVGQEVRACESWYPVGEQVTILFTLRNASTTTAVYNFSSGKQYDIWITSGGKEVFRLSRGKMYTQMLTNITLKPGEVKEFRTTWDQKDTRRKPVSSGWFTIHAQLTPSGAAPYEVSSRFWVGEPQMAEVSVTVSEAIRRLAQLSGQSVTIIAVYKGWKGDPNDPNLKPGPPVTRSDWVISDATGGMYVTGTSNLDPARDAGAWVKVTGKLAKTAGGQVYLIAQSVKLN